MAASFQFEYSMAFSPQTAEETLRAIPALPGVFALFGPPAAEGQPETQPYLTRAADLRRRVTRMLGLPAPRATEGDVAPQPQSKRLNLRTSVARIEYTVTGSEFESTLALYYATSSLFGVAEARRRLHLHTPYFLRFSADNAYPRLYATNRLSKRALDHTYGPFLSRAAAERYCDAVLDLFLLRRCYEDLEPYPEHPGCIYGEMKKCLAPCNQACTPAGAEAYAREAAAVERFLATRGESRIVEIGLAREEASNALHFERAAELHAEWHKVKAAQSLADELIAPIPNLRAVIVQKAAKHGPNPDGAEPLPDTVTLSEDATAVASQSKDLQLATAEPSAALFLLQGGCLVGPARLSTLGVRAVKEQTSVGSSLFAQPLMLHAIPLEEPLAGGIPTDEIPPPVGAPQPALSSSKGLEEMGESKSSAPATPAPYPLTTTALNPEARAAEAIASLETKAATPTDMATLGDHLSLLRRWYYRPEKRRAGEVFLPKQDGAWPIRRILNGAARAALGDPKPMADTNRDLAQRNPVEPEPARTKVLHAGRPDVERLVPVIDKPSAIKRRRKHSDG